MNKMVGADAHTPPLGNDEGIVQYRHFIILPA